MLVKEKAPIAVQRDEGGQTLVGVSKAESTARRAKRKAGSFWYEEGGRYLYRSGANGSTVFDVWKLIGAPLPRRGRA